MITGDIDLTEKLDFRKTVKREIPKLPAVWDVKNKINTDVCNEFTISSTNITYNTINSNISTTNFNFTTNVYFYDDIHYEWFDSTGLTISNPYNSNILEYYNGSTTVKVTPLKDKPEYDVFGNVKQHPEEIPKIPWSEKSKEYASKIPWNRYNYRFYIEDDKRIPWDNKRENSNGWFVMNSRNKTDRIRSSIAWLADKTSSFINRYLNQDDNNDLNYLTNMSWIRIHDAVVD